MKRSGISLAGALLALMLVAAPVPAIADEAVVEEEATEVVVEEDLGEVADEEQEPLGTAADESSEELAISSNDAPVESSAPENEVPNGASIPASGTWGTCPWDINSEGVLTVHPGTGAGWTGKDESPWAAYANEITRVVFAEENGQKVIAPPISRYMLAGLKRMESVDLAGLDISAVTNMGGLFIHCTSLTSLDLSDWDTSAVTSMFWMFQDCASLRELRVSGWDTSSVEYMNGMFLKCPMLTTLDLSGWDTSSVIYFNGMFKNCPLLTTVYADQGWSTASVRRSEDMFEGCTRLVGGNDTNYDSGHADSEYARIDASGAAGYLTSASVLEGPSIARANVALIPDQLYTGLAVEPEVTVTLDGERLSAGTDYDVRYIDNIDIGAAAVVVSGAGAYTNTGKAMVAFKIFLPAGVALTGTWGTCPWELSEDGVLTVHPGDGASQEGKEESPWYTYSESINEIVFVEEGGVKAVAPANSSWLFAGLDVSSFDTSGLDTSHVVNMSNMFNCARADIMPFDLSGWNTSSVTNMSGMFAGFLEATELDLSGWDTSKVKDMSWMFSLATEIKTLDLSGWDTSSVTDMSGMFNSCEMLESLDLSNWNTSKVKNMSSMFYWSGIETIDASGWNTSSVTNMSEMFAGCSGLETLDLSDWDTSKVTDMRHMFNDCWNLRTIYAGSKWSTKSLVHSEDMFGECWSIVGGNGTEYVDKPTAARYACIDTPSKPGYLTDAADRQTPIYRMYNIKTSEHLYTTSRAEYRACGAGAYADWRREGIAWRAPNKGDPGAKPVYRLYNLRSGDHHYTTSKGERSSLLATGDWRDEGVAFYSASKSTKGTIAVYRVYNGRLQRGQHHYSTSAGERNALVSKHGWRDEGVGFYGYKSQQAPATYILAGSDTRYYSRAELEKLSNWQLWMARNEIYARHGRTFANKEAQDYFYRQSWYMGLYSPDEYDVGGRPRVYNDYERANRDLIEKIEKERNSPYAG